jgi:uncharacterized protein YjbI with pentapeptide repeats
MGDPAPADRRRVLLIGRRPTRSACLVAGGLLVGCLILYARSGPANLEGAALRRRNLAGANLSHANLVRANLSGADLGHARLDGADMSVSQMVGTRLNGANLRAARMVGANMRGADLTTADLSDADMTNADLGPPDAQVRGAHYTNSTVWPAGFDPQSNGAVLDESDRASRSGMN